jgi:hypothetical protein
MTSPRGAGGAASLTSGTSADAGPCTSTVFTEPLELPNFLRDGNLLERPPVPGPVFFRVTPNGMLTVLVLPGDSCVELSSRVNE